MEATLSQNMISETGPEANFKNLFWDLKLIAAKTTNKSNTDPTTPPDRIMNVGISINRYAITQRHGKSQARIATHFFRSVGLSGFIHPS
jgi:hypothetical protein